MTTLKDYLIQENYKDNLIPLKKLILTIKHNPKLSKTPKNLISVLDFLNPDNTGLMPEEMQAYLRIKSNFLRTFGDYNVLSIKLDNTYNYNGNISRDLDLVRITASSPNGRKTRDFLLVRVLLDDDIRGQYTPWTILIFNNQKRNHIFYKSYMKRDFVINSGKLSIKNRNDINQYVDHLYFKIYASAVSDRFTIYIYNPIINAKQNLIIKTVNYFELHNQTELIDTLSKIINENPKNISITY